MEPKILMLFPHTPQEERRFQHLRHLGRRLHQRSAARTPHLLVLVAARASVGGRTTLAPAEPPAQPVGRRGIGLCGLLSSVITTAHSSSGGRTALQPCRHLSGGPGEGGRPGVSASLPPPQSLPWAWEWRAQENAKEPGQVGQDVAPQFP